MYQKTIEAFKSHGVEVQTGMFGAKMLVEIRNDGPVTIILDSDQVLSLND